MQPLSLPKLRKFPLYQQYFDNMELAISQVKQAKAWAVIGIGSNFSADLIERAKDPFQQRIPPPSVINGSTIHLYMDVTSRPPTHHMHCMHLSLCAVQQQYHVHFRIYHRENGPFVRA